MTADLRYRRDEDARPVDPGALFGSDLPDALERQREAIEPGAALLRLRPFTVDVAGESWTLSAEAGRVSIASGPGSGARLHLTPEALSDVVNDQATPMTFLTAGTLEMSAGGLGDFLDWWLVLRGALDARALHVPGAVSFRDRAGAPLDLRRSFALDDDPAEMRHFLLEAGFLHLAAVFAEEEMAAVSADMDRAAPSYRDGDGKSWWVTLASGERRVVRMQGFDRHSLATSELLADRRFARIGELPGAGHEHLGKEGNRIEALFKPIGVVAGISDVPWHKDCSLGRHSYECCSLTAGISVTGAGPRSGQLAVVPGSHRALVWPALRPPADLPQLDLPTRTGDVSVHLSCTLHKAHPPIERERRVMYTGFRLPGAPSEAAIAARRRLGAVREGAYTTVSQEPSPVR